MRPLFLTKTVVLALAIGAMASVASQAQDQPAPAPAADGGLPGDIAPGSPLAEVVKMIQAGVDAGTIKSFINNCQSPFDLDADKIVYLKDEGAPSDLINGMMDHDKSLSAPPMPPPQAPAPPEAPAAPEAPAPPEAASTPDMAPPSADVNINYFNDNLTPYGSWVNVDGYGRCWRPTVVIYDQSWTPYGDRGHWVYTDYGWYWDSDYSWGVTFHYGRWFRNPRFGWCWYPDTVWAPSWVTWRSSDAYCGWAPLPPFAVFRPGLGFFYRGVAVGLDFNFGLSADCFMFVSPAHFCDRRPRSFFVAPGAVPEVFRQTRVINNFNVNNKTIINRGISVDRIASVTHRPIEPVHVSALPNAGHQGWRGAGYQQTLRPTVGNYNSTHASGVNYNATGNTVHREGYGQTTQESQSGGYQGESYHSQVGNDNHVQTQTQTRQYNSYSAPAHGTPNNSASQYGSRQTFGTGTATANDTAQHGATELQQQQEQSRYGSTTQPRDEYRPQVQPKVVQPSATPGASQGQSQPRNSGNGGNNGYNNGSDKENH